MPSLPSAGGPPARNPSSGGARKLYLLELALGGAFVAVVAVVFFASTAHSTTVQLTEANWQREVVESPVPVVVDFWAPWCGPCRAVAPTIEKVATRFAGTVKVGKLNIDDAREIAARYNIDHIPQVLIFKGGSEPVRVIEPPFNESILVREIETVLKGKPAPRPDRGSAAE